MVESSTKGLDTFRDLIKFDHVYNKPDQTNASSLDDTKMSADVPVLSLNDIEIFEKLFDAPQEEQEFATDLSVKKDLNSSIYNGGLYSEKCDSGYSDAGSPYSHNAASPSSTSSMLDDAVWEESFSELFPNLV